LIPETRLSSGMASLVAFLSPVKSCVSSFGLVGPPTTADSTPVSLHAFGEPPGHLGTTAPVVAAVAMGLLSLTARRRRAPWGKRSSVVPRQTVDQASNLFGAQARRSRVTGAVGRAVRAARASLPAATRRLREAIRRRAGAATSQIPFEEVPDDNKEDYEELYARALRLVKIFMVVTFVPFLFCLKNFFFYNKKLSDFNLEYGPHLGTTMLKTTSMIQMVMIALMIAWRGKNRDSKLDRLFAWLFVPEGIFHILLHYLNHIDSWVGNFAFGYAFSAGIALPGFLSLIVWCPKNKLIPWLYMILYVVTQIPICNGLTFLEGPAKMRLNYANLNTATITGPFFYGMLKRWSDIPKVPVILACATITYQVTMGVIGPINSGAALKLYDPSVVLQHATVDIGFGLAYASSIYYGLFRPGAEWNAKR